MQSGKLGDLAEFGMFSFILTILMYGTLVYLTSRLFYFVRLRQTLRKPLAAAPMDPDKRLTILVPSYREEKAVVWRTLVSAAMVEQPRRRAMLLVDDPPHPRRKDDMETLASARALAGDVQALFDPVANRLEAGVAQLRADGVTPDGVASLFDDAAQFLESLAQDVDNGVHGGPADHTRSWFVERILRDPAKEYRARAAACRDGLVSLAELESDCARLTYLFRVELGFFERKLYVNMPKAADKATNLNAYLSLVGRRCVIRETPEGNFLEDVARDADTGEARVLDVPETDFVLVLDADSIVMPNYARTLLGIMEAPGGERIGVAQTPYLTFPNATSLLERVAGATTDIQFIIHQGMGALGAGFWVGANALVRMVAFRDIAQPATEDGHPFLKFIQDRTVIEDTGSTIDLRVNGWSVHNHVEGLAYSATPPDFGSLLIQRRRWANGGLILVPDLIAYFRQAKFTRAFVMEAFMRFHYLASQAFVSVGVLALLLYPFDDRFVSRMLPLTAVPYFILYAFDLKRIGYRFSDLPRVYSLNLMLLPIILGGVLKSVQQIVFGVKTPFARTPKVEGRTSTPAGYLLMEVGLLAWMLVIFNHDIGRDDREHAFFAMTSALAFLYGCIAMVGVRPLVEDIVLGFAQPFSSLLNRFFPSTRGRPGVARLATGAVAIMLFGMIIAGTTVMAHVQVGAPTSFTTSQGS